MTMLEVVGLRKQFGALVAINDLSLAIQEGEMLGLIGPNGSGKTTLFNLVSGFLKPTRGKVLWYGSDITGLPPYSIAEKGITRTFQLSTVYEKMTVRQNIIMACHLHLDVGLVGQFLGLGNMRAREKAMETRADELMEFTGLTPHQEKLACELSSGWRKALAISIAFATQPKLLLLDEPVTTLSQTMVEMIMRLVIRLRNAGTTVVLIEHNMKAIMDYCDRLVVMAYGEKIGEGTAREIRENRKVIDAYLGEMV